MSTGSADAPSAPGRPLISVVIPTWNRAGLTKRAIDSVLHQTFSDFEVVVVDDGSIDETERVVGAIPDRRVKYVRREHAGRGAARNAGVAAASGRYLTFLDSDDGAEPTWLQELSAAFAEPGKDVAFCGLHFVEPDGRRTPQVPSGSRPLGPDEVSPAFLPGCWMLPRELFLDCGGFDPDIGFGENSEVALRLYTRNPDLKVEVVPRPLIWMTRRTRPLDRAGQLEGAKAVIDRYGGSKELFPQTWASYHTILGAECARRGDLRGARRHFLEAARADPRGRKRVARLLVSCVPALARRTWPRL